jgi:hypothetical protein
MENPTHQEYIQDQNNEGLEVLDTIKKEINAFFEKEYNSEDVDEIKSEYVRLSNMIMKARWHIKERFGNEHPGIAALITLYSSVRDRVIYLFSRFVEESLAGSESSSVEVELEQIEKESNYQGNMTLLMIERMQSPEISAQLKELLYLDRIFNLYEKEKFTIERVADEFTEDIEAVSNDTPITFDDQMPSASLVRGIRENVDLAFCNPITGNEYNALQKSYIEAHEKGHYVRRLLSEAIENYFGKAFDLNRLTISEEYYQLLKDDAVRRYGEEAENMSFDEAVKSIVDYLRMPVEIMERMSQLKNYFGFSGKDVFTKQHLEYARLHYVNDTQMDNWMGLFLDCITPETEKHFLHIINNCGV